MIKKNELKQMPLEEIKIRLQDVEEEYINLKFQLALRQLDNPLKVRYTRRDIARLKTAIREHELRSKNEKNRVFVDVVRFAGLVFSAGRSFKRPVTRHCKVGISNGR